MKPKDLLEHLEKGDRTMHHLMKKPEPQMFGLPIVTLNGVFDQAFARTSAYQMAATQNGSWQTYNGIQAANTTTGGILR